MSYTAPPILQFSMPMVPVSNLSGVLTLNAINSAATTAAWSVANEAHYVPFRVPAGVLVKRLWVSVGATGGTDTWDLGIYTDGGVQIVHMGSTTAGTANTIQFMDITDTYLAPGSYYMAMSSSGTTATIFASSPALPFGAVPGLLKQATAHPLPATATFASWGSAQALRGIPVMGYCTTATP